MPPRATAFVDAEKAGPTAKVPSWWKARFDTPQGDGPVRIDLAGMRKGQCYVNGHHLGRYFVSIPTGRAIPPQAALYVPRAWLKDAKPNDLLIFDEHGANPAKVRVTVGQATPIRA